MSTTPVLTQPSSSWRPPQWAKPSKVLVTVPAGWSGAQASGATDPSTGVFTVQNTVTAPTSYVFDAVLALEHEQTLTKTSHPVQTGASISSHAYIEPATLVLYVLMSDVTPQYVAANQTVAPYIQSWTGSPSKSVSAYQQMLTLQAARIPLTVTTRLRTYANMLILRVAPREDDKTVTGARFRIELSQLFIANTQAAPLSARPNDTQSTGLGAVNPVPPSPTVNTQFNVDDSTGDASNPQESLLDWLAANPSGVNVPGAGSYSSVNTNSMQQLPSPS